MASTMIKKSKLLKLLNIFTLVAFMFTMVFGAASMAYASTRLSDIEGHWAQSTIQDMVNEGIIGGYPDGTFKPNNNITRAEFASLIVRAFNLKSDSGKVFNDTANHWAKGAISTANYYGLVSGYSDSVFGPDDPVTREQIAVMIVNATKVDSTEEVKAFTDSAKIAAWAKESVAKATAAGLIAGYPDGIFRPKANATRAEAAVILDRGRKLTEKEVVATEYDRAGTYGPESGTQTIDGDVTISADGVILRNIIIKGNLIISEAVGDGDVTLNNVTVKGSTYIRGGGKDSIHIHGGQYNNIIIESTPGGNVRLVATNAEGLKVIISENAAGEEIILEGTFESVAINADNVVLSTRGETTINEIKVHENITGTTIDIDKNTTVKELVLDSVTEVNNAKGTVGKISGDKASDSPISNLPEKEASGGGGGGEGSSVVAVSAIRVEGVPVVGETLSVETTPPGAAATGVYQWLICDTEDGEYVEIGDATYTPGADDVGKYIKVKITGKGNYRGTVTSDPVEIKYPTLKQYLESSTTVLEEYTLTEDETTLVGLSVGAYKKIILNGKRVTISGTIDTGGFTITSTGGGAVVFAEGFSITGANLGDVIIVNTGGEASYQLAENAQIPDGYEWRGANSNTEFYMLPIKYDKAEEEIGYSSTISEAISEVADGGTITVGPGTYEGEDTLTINKPLTLKSVAGADETTIKGYITVTGENVTIEGFTIKKSEAKPAITLRAGSKDVTISNNIIDGNNKGDAAPTDAGIRVLQDAKVTATITGNEIVNNKGNGIYVHTGGWESEDDEFVISDNLIENNRTGIVIDGKEEQVGTVKIIGNTLKENTAHGISVGPATGYKLTITGNIFEGNKRTHFSDRRYTAENDEDVDPDKEAITSKNTFVPEACHWKWDETGVRWLLKIAPTITVNEDLARKSAVGLYDCFTVSTAPEGFENETVKVKLEATPATGFELEYVEQDPSNTNCGNYLSLPVGENGEAWFGPGTGFPLAAVADSMFRVTWTEAGTYEFTLKIMAVAGEGNFTKELASTTEIVTVVEGEPVAISYATGDQGAYAIANAEEFSQKVSAATLETEPIEIDVEKGETELDLLVVAELPEEYGHVDNVIFAFEVTKDNGEGISQGDFEVTAISLRGEGITEGINNTFKVENNTLTGYWGPSGGFQFEGVAATAFTVKFNSEGTYTVKVKAVQVEVATEADLNHNK